MCGRSVWLKTEMRDCHAQCVTLESPEVVSSKHLYVRAHNQGGALHWTYVPVYMPASSGNNEAGTPF